MTVPLHDSVLMGLTDFRRLVVPDNGYSGKTADLRDAATFADLSMSWTALEESDYAVALAVVMRSVT